MDDIVERLKRNNDIALAMGRDYSDLLLDAATEIERLRAAASTALPWLCSMEHMGSLVDHESLSNDIDKLTAVLGWVRKDA
jgi:hypothetical protein